jgi:hypothetical protein
MGRAEGGPVRLYPADLPCEAEPRPGTIYSVGGINTGLKADPRLPRDYPMEAFCLRCGGMIRLESFMPVGAVGDWQHTGRRPGE